MKKPTKADQQEDFIRLNHSLDGLRIAREILINHSYIDAYSAETKPFRQQKDTVLASLEVLIQQFRSYVKTKNPLA